MYSARKFLSRKLSNYKRPHEDEDYFRPRIGIRVWLTILFILVTAFAESASYAVVQPILYNALNKASKSAFNQVGDQFEKLIRRDEAQNEKISDQQISSFAASRDLQWGIVRAEDGTLLRGTIQNQWWLPGVVEKAVKTQRPQQNSKYVPTGDRAGQLLSTYAMPVDDTNGKKGLAIVFVKFTPESEPGNIRSAIVTINRVVLIAGVLGFLIAGLFGYIAADLISRRVSRLGLAAERLAAGNFQERITTRIKDEVGSLGTTFNSMAASLQDAFRQIEQEKERGQAILDGMTDAVVGVDGELNTIFLNPRARELLESSDLAFQERLQEILAKTHYSGPITEPEVRVGDRIIEIRAAPLEEGALAILRDVTQESRIERTKTEFIANASHELKTPLTSLSGYLEMLEDEDDEETRTAFVEDMRLQTTRLQSLAQTLLDLSRLDANATVFRREEVDLEYLLHELRRDFGYTGRTVNVHAEGGVPPVHTDPTQLHRMLAILMDNALKYSEEGSAVDLDLRQQDGNAVISISDRGCGIPEDELPYIFERFYRAQGSSRAGGTGLGLSLAREIADHLGGEIHVSSKQGSGSTFSVSLPLFKGQSSS